MPCSLWDEAETAAYLESYEVRVRSDVLPLSGS